MYVYIIQYIYIYACTIAHICIYIIYSLLVITSWASFQLRMIYILYVVGFMSKIFPSCTWECGCWLDEILGNMSE